MSLDYGLGTKTATTSKIGATLKVKNLLPGDVIQRLI